MAKGHTSIIFKVDVHVVFSLCDNMRKLIPLSGPAE